MMLVTGLPFTENDAPSSAKIANADAGPELGASGIPAFSSTALAGTDARPDATRAKPAPKARPLRVMFLVMFILISWFAHNQLIAGCKR
jgi:hypothetical protein